MATSIKRQYIDLAGVDFKNDESLVNLNRSPDALNIYKDYTTEGNCIQSRPGYRKLAELDTNSINGIYIYSTNKALVHSGTKLYLWNNFPTVPSTQNLIMLSETTPRLCVQRGDIHTSVDGFAHSETPGSKDVCSSPGIIAACRVLHRLPVPRHPPCARGILRDRIGPAGYPRVAKIN